MISVGGFHLLHPVCTDQEPENSIDTKGVSDEFSADVDADADENFYSDADADTETDADKFVDNNYKGVLSDDFSAGEEEE